MLNWPRGLGFASSSTGGETNIGAVSRFFGLDAIFKKKVLRLLDLGYALRFRLPLFVSAGFVLCHLFAHYVPRVEINVQVIEEEEVVEDGDGDDEEEEEDDVEDDEDNAP